VGGREGEREGGREGGREREKCLHVHPRTLTCTNYLFFFFLCWGKKSDSKKY
jgi:hypothetical protein